MSIQTRSIIFAVASIGLFGSVSAQARDVGWYVATQAQSPIWVQVANKGHQNDHQLLQGNREVLGKVEAIISDQIKVDVGEVQPRFLPLQQAKEKHFPSIRSGDNLIIVVNEQNLIVDYHPLDHPSSHHAIIRGTIVGNMPTGHDVVVIKGAEGKEQSFKVRSQVRSKVASIPVGTPAIFLVDETGRVADATFASLTAAKEAYKNPEDKSPIKGANRQVDGIVGEPLRVDRITLRTEGGERSFEVRDVMHERISKLQKGESVILLVDKDDKVVDMAVPPQ